MRHATLLSLLRPVLGAPTAPFHEYHAAAVIRRLLAPLPHVSVREDGYGNLIATYRRGRRPARLAFGAHLDHPGWVRDPAHPGAPPVFLGGVPADRLDKAPIRWHGAFGMWDLPAFALEDGLVRSRACDDLVGCAEIVALFHELERTGAAASCHGIFTRAEEVGFVGAAHLARAWPFPPGVGFVSLETSSPRGGAEMGKGPVVRVGDRMSVFDDQLTAALLAAAEAAGISAQRALLDGGSCEATAMQLHGIRSAAMSVLLGNYHNCSPDGGIAAEYVSLADVKATIRLITAAVVSGAGGPGASPGRAAMKKRLEQRAREHRAHDRAGRLAARGLLTSPEPAGGPDASPARPRRGKPRPPLS